jgi:sugar phosphate isomerase/epimerase
MKFSLYSITYLGLWYKGGALTWKEVLKKAKDFGYDGVEFDGKRPHANPMDWDEYTRKSVVEEAAKLGLALPALSANNDFSSPIPEHREAQLLMVKEQTRLARDLGCKILRIFAAWPGISVTNGIASYDAAKKNWANFFPDVPVTERKRMVLDCLKEAAKFGEEFGVTVALQNHRPLTMDWQDTFNMVKAVDSPWLKMCYDLPIAEDDPDWIRKGFDTIGDMDVHYHFNGEFHRDASGKVVTSPLFGKEYIKHYPFFISEMKRIGYDGWLSFEFCHELVDDKLNILGIDEIDKQTQLALEYIKGLANQ